jgi:hypothetical protein
VDVEVAGHEREPSIARPRGEPTRGERGAAKRQIAWAGCPGEMKLNVKFR